MTPAQGDIYWAETEEKRRPVLIVTRSEAIPVLVQVLAAPVTTTVRGIPTEIPLGAEHGLSESSVAVFDDLRRVRRSALTKRVGSLAKPREEICRALAALADC